MLPLINPLIRALRSFVLTVTGTEKGVSGTENLEQSSITYYPCYAMVKKHLHCMASISPIFPQCFRHRIQPNVNTDYIRQAQVGNIPPPTLSLIWFVLKRIEITE